MPMLLDYQRDVYKDMCNVLANNNCCCVIMGTGVGKTYVANAYLKEHNYKALVVSPRHFINDNWVKLCGDKVDTITYQKLYRIYDTIDFSKYDIVICDEVHHIGAVKWGKPIKDLIDKNIIKVIGLTESSVRYTDGARDVAQEYFNSNIAIGYDVSSAIKENILNPVTYVGALYNSDGLKKTLRGKIQSRLYAKLNLVLNNTPTVQDILKKNMPEGKRKGIIFASTIKDIPYAIDFIHSVYPNARIEIIHSKQSQAYNDKAMSWFNTSDEGYLCSVDMLSEGVHIKGINTLIMLRRTESPNVFNQQLGRCLDANSKEPAILFDLVNNKYSVRIINNKLHIRINQGFNDVQSFTPVNSQQLIIKDYTKDIVDVLQEIQNDLLGRWTEEEDTLLKKYYSELFNNMTLKVFGKQYLPNRTYLSLKVRARTLGIQGPAVVNYTEEEDNILKKYYPDGGSKVCLSYLPSRDVKSINQRANKLGLVYEPWAQEDINKLINHYPTMGNTIVNIIPNHTIYSIRAKARSLRVFSNNISRKFTNEEDDLIRKYYPDKGSDYLHELIPSHTSIQISHRAKVIGVHRNDRIKAVQCIETGKIYSPISSVVKDLNLRSRGSTYDIIKCCKGLRKTAYGYHWKYINKKGGK